MEANALSFDFSLPNESKYSSISSLTGLLLSTTKSAPSNVFACEFISSKRLFLNAFIATKALIPKMIELVNSSSRDRDLRLSRHAIFQSQELGTFVGFVSGVSMLKRLQ
jgi:hypothetical protein